MKSRIHKFMAVLAILPVLTVLAGCPDPAPDPNPTPTPTPTPTPKPNVLQQYKAVETQDINQVFDSFRVKNRTATLASRTRQMSPQTLGRLDTWQTQIQIDIPSMPDHEVLAGYTILIAALDTQNDAQIAGTLSTLTVSPRALNVFLHRLTPTMRQELWSRLTLAKINSLSAYLSQADSDSLAHYLADLAYLDLAPTTSVPWDRVP